MTDRIALAEEILAFLEKHAKASADYDPRWDEPGERFNGPDSAMMHEAALGLLDDREFPMPQSSWGSGCYQPMGNTAAAQWHDRLRIAVREILDGSRPRSEP